MEHKQSKNNMSLVLLYMINFYLFSGNSWKIKTQKTASPVFAGKAASVVILTPASIIMHLMT